MGDVMAIEKVPCRLIVDLQPRWIVGERDVDKYKRWKAQREVSASERRPGDYQGRIAQVARPGEAISVHADTQRVVEMRLSEQEISRAKSNQVAFDWRSGKLRPLVLEDRYGAVAKDLRAEFGLDAEDLALAEFTAFEDPEGDSPKARFERRKSALVKALPACEAHTGTGLYEVKTTPTHNDDTQSGAASGQTITLVTGGLGTDDAFKGGYVTNATEAETRAIVSHTDDTITLEGDLTNWTDTDDLDIYDAWSTIQGGHDQLWTDQSTTLFDAKQTISIYSGTYTECVTFQNLGPEERYHLVIKASSGENVTWSCQADTGIVEDDPAATPFVDVEDITISGTATGIDVCGLDASSRQWVFRRCTIGGDSSQHKFTHACYGYVWFVDCELSGADGMTEIVEYWGHAGGFLRCKIHDFNIVVNSIRSAMIFESNVIYDCTYVCHPSTFNYYGSQLHFRNNTVYNLTTTFLRFYHGNAPQSLFIQNNIFHTVPTLFYEHGAYTDFDQGVEVRIDGNCYYNVTKWLDSVTDADITDFASWQALGYDANGFEAASDPLTDAAGGDFSLADASECHARVPHYFGDVDYDGNEYRQPRGAVGAYRGNRTRVY